MTTSATRFLMSEEASPVPNPLKGLFGLWQIALDGLQCRRDFANERAS